jgi:hypothetical protein
MLVRMSGKPAAVVLREVTGDPEELRALQRVMENDEDYFLRVTGHPPGPADAQSTIMFVPEGRSPDDKAPFGVWAGDEAAPPQRGPHQRPGPRLLAPDGLHRDRRGPPLALRL